MIDTVILTIPRDKMRTLDDSQGLFQNWELESTGKGYKKYIKNTTKEETKRGLSFIKLTGYTRNDRRGGFTRNVNIEFSATKLITNAINEPKEKDFSLEVSTLKQRLLDMGEVVALKDLQNAEVASFHPFKNIILSDGFTATGVIRELHKINVSKKFDLTGIKFANDGTSLQIHTKSHSIVFYDKIADLAKDSIKAIDKDQTPQQKTLFDEIKKEQPALEVIRMEVRLSQKRKMKEILKKLELVEKPVFADIFKKDVCQKIVRWYWEEIIKGENLFLFELLNSPKRLLRKVLRNDRKIQPKHSVFLVGLSVLCKDDDGIRELREILEKYTKQRNWYRFADGIKLLNSITNKKALYSWVKQIDDAINDFKSITGSDIFPEKRE